MKRILTLPLFMAIALVSLAWGAYTVCTGDHAGFCKWDTCGEIAIQPGESWSKETCEEAYNNCVENGYLYTDAACVTWSGKGNNPNFNDGVPIWCQWTTGCESIKNADELDNCKTNGSVYIDVTDAGKDKKCDGTWTGGKDPNAVILGCCKWSTEENCYPIYDGENSEGVSGATQVTNCKSGSNIFWDGSGACPTSCPTTTPTYPVSSPSSSPSGNSSSSAAPATPSSSSAAPATPSSSSVAPTTPSSSSTGGGDISSSSGDGTDAIISHNNAPVFGLSVTGLARGLQIASDKNATISLFNMHGKRIFSQKVQSGTTTISLEKQKVGVYYAVAKSGSQKQLVKIVLK